MSKQDFIALADALKETYDSLELSEAVVQALCGFMRAQNPRFMEERWRAYLSGACGPNGGKVKA